MRSVRQIVAVAAALVIAAAQVTGCTTGEDAVAQGGTFDFVSPGGQTAIFYDPPSSRVTIGDLNGPDLFTDETIWLSDFTGKVVLINVWGSWCAPCRTETPELETVYAEYRDRGVQFLGIDVRDNRDTARDSVTDRNVHIPPFSTPQCAASSPWDAPIRPAWSPPRWSSTANGSPRCTSWHY